MDILAGTPTLFTQSEASHFIDTTITTYFSKHI